MISIYLVIRGCIRQPPLRLIERSPVATEYMNVKYDYRTIESHIAHGKVGNVLN